MNEAVYVIVPVYNEAKMVSSVVSKLTKTFKNTICIDDGSHDDSVAEIKKTIAILIKHPLNLGQGAALQTGIEYALRDPSAKYFATFDADGQHSVGDVIKMLAVLKADNLDVVLGSRFLGQTENMGRSRTIILKTAIKISNFLSGIKLTDAHNGLRVFNRRFAKALNLEISDMGHASEIIEKLAHGGFRFKEVPVTITYSQYSKAKGQSLMNIINIGFDTLLRRLKR